MDLSKKAVLLSGPPGIGKTSSAMIITRSACLRQVHSVGDADCCVLHAELQAPSPPEFAVHDALMCWLLAPPQEESDQFLLLHVNHTGKASAQCHAKTETCWAVPIQLINGSALSAGSLGTLPWRSMPATPATKRTPRLWPGLAAGSPTSSRSSQPMLQLELMPRGARSR